MFNNYINGFSIFLSNALFFCFKYIIIFLVVLLIFSLVLLAIGCLIKSQNLKSKFLIAVPTLIGIIIIILGLPYIYLYIKNFI